MLLPWSNFYPLVTPWVIGCPYPTVDAHLLQAARTFFTRTRAWRVDLDPTLTVAGEKTYDLDLPPGSILVRLEGAKLAGRELVLGALDAPPGAFDARTADAMTLTLADAPCSDDVEIAVAVSLAPNFVAIGIESELFGQFAEAIAHGALASLLRMPSPQWRDATLAVDYEARFELAIGEAMSRLWHGFANTRPRVKSIFF